MKTPSRVSLLTLEGDLADLGVLLGVELVERRGRPCARTRSASVRPSQRFGGDQRAVAQCRDPLAEREDLLEPVRDEQHGGALLAQRPHHA